MAESQDLGLSETWTYRCAECGTGEHLTACAEAIAFGPVGHDGSLAHHDDVDETRLCEDSIQCNEHPDAEIQRCVDGEWRRWFCCERCQGTGNRGGRHYWRCDACEPGRSIGWLTPVEEPAHA